MSRKLLLADDSVVIQKLVGLSFANEQIEIVSTDNGDDAVRLAKEARPDVVLADVVMPGRSGYEVCEAIKQDPELRATPVLLLTGTFEAFDEARAATAGADGHVTKPFEAQALVERVNQVIEAAAAAPLPPPSRATSDPSARRDAPSSPRHDLFDADVTRLAETDPGLAADLDDPNELTASGLFGAPGEAAIEVLDDQGGNMSLGRSMDPVVGEATPPNPIDVEAPLPPLSERVSREDPLEELAEPTPLPPARPLDLDEVLARAPLDDSPVLDSAAGSESAPAAPTPQGTDFDELIVHVPSADIDQDAAAAPTPDYAQPTMPPYASTSPADRPDVTDLDASLASPAGTPPPIPEPAPAVTPPPIPEPEAAPAPTRLTASDPLGLGPAMLDSDDVDFAFDVSEQAAASDLDEALDESFASLMDLSESQLLSEDVPDVTTTARSHGREDSLEPIFEGYDVSSSDLVHEDGDETWPPAGNRAGANPMPEPDPLTEIRALPVARSREPAAMEAEQTVVAPVVEDAVEAAPAEPITGLADLFDGLVTGSPLDELDDLDADDLGLSSELDVEEDLLEIDAPEAVGAPFAPWRTAEADVLAEPTLDEGHLQDDAIADAVPLADDDEAAIDFTGDATDVAVAEPFSVTAPPMHTAETSEARPVEESDADAPVLLPSSPHGAPEDRRVPDLSPMMEQRIQETLEKVAWEAFSDLSETIVKQVMGRVEQIAWEVIPEMAETLVREEIRRMKGEED
jgi:CheY-like chemotaxis protein